MTITAMPSARAATPTGLSRSASSCKHGIPIAERVPRFVPNPLPPSKTVEEFYEEEMELASATLLEAVNLARRGWTPRTPANLIWRIRSGEDAALCTGYMGDRYEPEAIAPRPAPRDPCTYCGTRADIGCKHTARGF